MPNGPPRCREIPELVPVPIHTRDCCEPPRSLRWRAVLVSIGVGTILLASLAPGQDAGPGPALRARFDALAEQGFSGAVLVAEGDQVLLRAAAGLADRVHGRVNQADTIFDVGSLTKQFTAAAVLLLAERGKLAVDDTLERFFDDVPKDKRAIRLHHLLTHTSGLPTDVGVGRWTSERAELLAACWEAKLVSKPGSEYATTTRASSCSRPWSRSPRARPSRASSRARSSRRPG